MVIHLDTTEIVTPRRTPAVRRRRREARPAPRSAASPEAKPGEASTQAQALYLAAALRAGEAEAQALRDQAWRIGALLRRVFEGGGGVLAAAERADLWLARRFGRRDDELRRALSASLALAAPAPALPQSILALYPTTHLRLANFLAGSAPYDPDFFGKDLAFACGFFVPIGPLSLGLPSSGALGARLWRARKAAGLLVRTARAGEGGRALALARSAGVRPWAELHVDTRNLRAFNAEGFEQAYHRLAALMRQQPRFAGVHGASWLYDPVLAEISPALDFVFEPIRSGGAVNVRLGVDPVQTAYAVSRSSLRRELWREGRYQPACYGMYWPRDRLIAWSEARP